MSANWYELLGVDVGANNAAVRRAYRRQALAVHPDKNPAPEAAELFHRLSEALEALLDPIRRAGLDEQLAADARRAARRAQESERARQLRADLEAREKQAAQAAGRRAAQSSDQGRGLAVKLEQLRREAYELRRSYGTANTNSRYRTVKIQSNSLERVLAGIQNTESVLRKGDTALLVFKTIDQARETVDTVRRNGTQAWILEPYLSRSNFDHYYQETHARAQRYCV